MNYISSCCKTELTETGRVLIKDGAGDKYWRVFECGCERKEMIPE